MRTIPAIAFLVACGSPPEADFAPTHTGPVVDAITIMGRYTIRYDLNPIVRLAVTMMTAIAMFVRTVLQADREVSFGAQKRYLMRNMNMGPMPNMTMMAAATPARSTFLSGVARAGRSRPS